MNFDLHPNDLPHSVQRCGLSWECKVQCPIRFDLYFERFSTYCAEVGSILRVQCMVNNQIALGFERHHTLHNGVDIPPYVPFYVSKAVIHL